jgi:hypothetical protein
VAEILKRFFIPLWVFNFGMIAQSSSNLSLKYASQDGGEEHDSESLIAENELGPLRALLPTHSLGRIQII